MVDGTRAVTTRSCMGRKEKEKVFGPLWRNRPRILTGRALKLLRTRGSREHSYSKEKGRLCTGRFREVQGRSSDLCGR